MMFVDVDVVAVVVAAVVLAPGFYFHGAQILEAQEQTAAVFFAFSAKLFFGLRGRSCRRALCVRPVKT